MTTVDSLTRARFGRVLAGLAATLATALAVTFAWPPAPAAAQDAALTVSGLQTAPGVVRFLLTASDLPLNTPIDPTKVTVSVGERELVSEASKVSRSASKLPPRGLMVVLDVSGSVVGARLAAAKGAVRELASNLPEDVRVGLIAVSDKPKLLLQPTEDRAALTAAADGMAAEGNTALYDAVALADDTLAKAGFGADTERRVLVLSDGLDTASETSLAEITKRLKTGGLATDVVAFQADKKGLDALQALADPAGGRVLTAPDATFVTQAFRAVAGGFSVVLAVEVVVPKELGQRQESMAVTLETTAGTLSTAVPVTFALSPPSLTAPELQFGWIPSWAMWAVGGMLFVGVIVMVVVLAWPSSGKEARIRQIEQFGPARLARAANPESAAALTRAALSASAALVRSRGLDERITLSLEQAGMRLRPHEWVLLRACIIVPFGGLALVLIDWRAVPVGALVGWLATGAYRSVRASRRAAAFNEQLPDALQLVIGSLRAGFSLPQALDSLVRESPDPVAAEFGRALAENRLGADISEALERVAQRTKSDDLEWAVMAVRIQREVGGNLAEVLQTTVDTIRERGRLRRHVRSLSAEGRLSAYVLIALPILLGLFMFTFRREYLRPLYTEPVGFAMLLVGVSLLGVGIVWMARTVKVEA